MAFPVDIRYVKEAEQQLGVKFPPAYVVDLCKINGGAVDTTTGTWFLYPFWDRSDKKRLKRTCNDVVRETNNSREWIGFPESAVAIGANGCGDKLILLPTAETDAQLHHTVYWWCHETGAVEEVADDFSELTRHE